MRVQIKNKTLGAQGLSDWRIVKTIAVITPGDEIEILTQW